MGVVVVGCGGDDGSGGGGDGGGGGVTTALPWVEFQSEAYATTRAPLHVPRA